MNTIKLDGNSLTLQALIEVSRNGAKVALSDDAIQRMQASRQLVEDYVNEERVVYGITTGFGLFADVVISKEQTKLLQKNLILADCCSMGDPYKDEVVRAAMLLRINALAKGFSGIRLSTVQLLIDMLNCGIHPIIPEQGSVGASGDLSPLAHIVLVMLGSGEARYKGEIVEGLEALKKEGLEPVELVSKEGLALINGTCVLTAVGALATYDAIKVLKLADISASMTVEALSGIIDAYDEKIHLARPHQGQIQVAQNMLQIL
ncbi:MAG: aromatic amino acid lyase, partial [Clostridia bacterium]|nr:aromatic amino acid lyase [Clostridia bacterium]